MLAAWRICIQNADRGWKKRLSMTSLVASHTPDGVRSNAPSVETCVCSVGTMHPLVASFVLSREKYIERRLSSEGNVLLLHVRGWDFTSAQNWPLEDAWITRKNLRQSPRTWVEMPASLIRNPHRRSFTFPLWQVRDVRDNATEGT